MFLLVGRPLNGQMGDSSGGVEKTLRGTMSTLDRGATVDSRHSQSLSNSMALPQPSQAPSNEKYRTDRPRGIIPPVASSPSLPPLSPNNTMDAVPVRSTKRAPKPTKSSTVTNVRPLRQCTQALLAALERPRAKAARPRRVDSRTKKLTTLTSDVTRLQAEVARLMEVKEMLKQQTLNRADNNMGSAVRMVKEYFDVFRLGYVPPTPKELANSPACESKPDAFLFSMMDEEVLGGGFRGVDIMIEQWKRYGACFSGFKINLQRAEVSSIDIDPETGLTSRVHVTASAYYSSHLLLAGVEAMFPHVMSNAALVMSLIGQVIGGLGSYRFVYDCKRQQFAEMVIDIDMIGAFAKVVSNAHDLGLLFGSALLTSQYYMGDDVPLTGEPLVVPDQPPSPTSSSSSTIDEDEDGNRVVEQMSIDRILCGGEAFEEY